MSKSAQFGRNLLFALILSVFVLPVANAGLVEIYINKSEELTESETEFIIESIMKYNKNKSEELSFCDLGTGSGCIIISILKHYYNCLLYTSPSPRDRG